MGAFDDPAAIPPQRFFDGFLARSVHGERLTLAVVDIKPGGVLRDTVTFRVGAEEEPPGPRSPAV